MHLDFFTPLFIHNSQDPSKDSFLNQVGNFIEGYFSFNNKCAVAIIDKNQLSSSDQKTSLAFATLFMEKDITPDVTSKKIWKGVKIASYATVVIPLCMLFAKLIWRSSLSINLKEPDEKAFLSLFNDQNFKPAIFSGTFNKSTGFIPLNEVYQKHIIDFEDYGYYLFDPKKDTLTRVENSLGDPVSSDESHSITLTDSLLKHKINEQVTKSFPK